MSSYARNLSTRLFIQAAFTGVMAPIGSHGSMWLMLTFAIAAVAVGIGLTIRDGHARMRELVLGFEAVAVAVGVVGLVGHHYIPGTIVGAAALIAAWNTPTSSTAAEAPVEAPADGPRPAYAGVPAQPVVTAEPVAEAVAYPDVPAQAAPVAGTPVADPAPHVAEPAPVVAPPVMGRRAIDILPGR